MGFQFTSGELKGIFIPTTFAQHPLGRHGYLDSIFLSSNWLLEVKIYMDKWGTAPLRILNLTSKSGRNFLRCTGFLKKSPPHDDPYPAGDQEDWPQQVGILPKDKRQHSDREASQRRILGPIGRVTPAFQP